MQVFLNCEVSEGMFPSERLVIFETVHDKHVELYVSESRLVQNKFAVDLIRINERANQAMISLPSAPINTSSYVTVRLDQLSELPAIGARER